MKKAKEYTKQEQLCEQCKEREYVGFSVEWGNKFICEECNDENLNRFYKHNEGGYSEE